MPNKYSPAALKAKEFIQKMRLTEKDILALELTGGTSTEKRHAIEGGEIQFSD
jgi:hypothetical protein